MLLFYAASGINHFINPRFYKEIMPPYLPCHFLLIYLSGICEIVFGLMLIPVYTRRTAAWLIIALLIAVFPANIQMTLNYLIENNPYLWITIVRLPLQFILIWWAWIFTKQEDIKIR